MKKKSILRNMLCWLTLLGCFLSAACGGQEAAASAPTEEPTPEATAEPADAPVILKVTNPYTGYIQGGAFFINWTKDTSFSRGWSSYGHVDVDKKIQLERRIENNRFVYTIAGNEYVVLTQPDPNETPYYAGCRWSYDRAFFDLYAKTDMGELYRNVNTKSMEVLILKRSEDREWILIARDSPLLDCEKYDIDDFGLLFINDKWICRASDFSDIFLYHTRPQDEAMELEDLNFVHDSRGYYLSWEYTRFPGLRYYFFITMDVTTGINYLYVRPDQRVLVLPFTMAERLGEG